VLQQELYAEKETEISPKKSGILKTDKLTHSLYDDNHKDEEIKDEEDYVLVEASQGMPSSPFRPKTNNRVTFLDLKDKFFNKNNKPKVEPVKPVSAKPEATQKNSLQEAPEGNINSVNSSPLSKKHGKGIQPMRPITIEVPKEEEKA
jgi:hypothetical protein